MRQDTGIDHFKRIKSVVCCIEEHIEETWKREKVLLNGRYLRDGLRSMGLSARGELHIVPWIIGDETRAEMVYQGLLERGVFAPVMRYPAVPMGRALIRFMPMATHTAGHIEQVLDACRTVGRKLRISDAQPDRPEKARVSI